MKHRPLLVILAVVILLTALGGCAKPPATGPTVTPLDPATTTNAAPTTSPTVDLPQLAETVAPPFAWRSPYTATPTLQKPWKDLPAEKYTSWEKLVSDLRTNWSFGVGASDELAKKMIIFSNSAEVPLANWPYKVQLSMGTKEATTVYVFRGRSKIAPSWFNFKFGTDDLTTQISQAGTLTVLDGDEAPTDIHLYGWITRLHTDTPGSIVDSEHKWAWMYEWYNGVNEYHGDWDKKAQINIPDVASGQLPNDPTPPWGEWPKEGLGTAAVKDQTSPSTNTPAAAVTAPPAAEKAKEPNSFEATLTWGSDDMVTGGKKIGAESKSRPTWVRKGQKVIITRVDTAVSPAK